VAAVAWTLEAIRCLEIIHDSIAAENPRAAIGGVRGIYAKVQLLRDHPRLGQRYEPIVDREVRETSYGHYRIAYLIVNETRIEVLGVFHGRMDIDRYLH
jgi:plasmid stabilization system protein ParE